MMTALAFSDSVARLHAPLVQRADAIVGAVMASGAPLLRTAADPLPQGPGGCITLERANQDRLRRDDGRGRFTLAYRDGASPTALAALLAAMAAPGAPIAADPESLSILALAQRLNDGPPHALASIKELVSEARHHSFTEQLALERSHFVRNLQHAPAGETRAASADPRA